MAVGDVIRRNLPCSVSDGEARVTFVESEGYWTKKCEGCGRSGGKEGLPWLESESGAVTPTTAVRVTRCSMVLE
ncbi:MAG: hypothetical protein WC841_04170 [Candidatus Shapirobacteria bacterium]